MSEKREAHINEDPNRALVGFGGFWRVLVGFIGLYRVLWGFIGFYRVLSGFIRFYRVSSVLSGFILPLFIELPQLASTAALLLFPAMATFRYKQANTINSLAKGIFFSIVEGPLVPADAARKEGDVARNSAESYGSRCN